METAPGTPDLVELRRQVDALPWFHQIDFGNGILSPGRIRIPKIKRNANVIFSRVSVQDRSVLDIGCWDGAYSLEALRRGASRVLSTDYYAWHDDGDRRAFELVRKHLAPSLEAMEIDVPDLSVERVGTFDVVFFLGVLYHLRHPFLALERVAKIAKECLVVESRMLYPFTRRKLMRFYPNGELDGDLTSWWVPNRACLEAMLRDLGFRKILFRHPDRRWRRGIFHAFR